MFEALVASTGSAGLRPLGSAAQRSWDLVSGTVRARLGDDHAALFAEPVATAQGDRIDWYAPRQGTALALSDLEPADRDAVQADLAAKVEAIRLEAARLSDGADPEAQRLGEALANALEVPDEGAVHAIRSADGTLHPVLVNWAWVKGDAQAVRGVLSGMARRPVPAAAALAAPGAALPGATPAASALPPSAASGPVAAGPWWLLILAGWLLLALMLATILWLTIAPCGLSPLVTSRFCPATAVALAHDPGPDRAVLEDRLADLERRIAQSEAACLPVAPAAAPALPDPVPVPAPEPEPAAPPPARDAEVDRRLQDSGAQTGELAVTLVWDGTDDLDLAVTCPGGQTISYVNTSACGGELDVDANVGRTRNDPVENVFFTAAAPGDYQVRVTLYSNRTRVAARDFTLYVRQPGRADQVLRGQVSTGRPWRQTITIGR